MSVEEFFSVYDAALKAAGSPSESSVMRAAGVGIDTMRNARRRTTAPDLLAVVKIAHTLNVPPFEFLKPLGLTPNMLFSSAPDQSGGDVAHDRFEVLLLKIWRAMSEEERLGLMALLKARIDTNAA